MVWFMLHSGSRGVGNRMGSYFIELAKRDMGRWPAICRTKISPISRSTEHFFDYVEAVEWAQDFARTNRDLMMEQIISAVRESGEVRPFIAQVQVINCHHNYVARESHFGQNVLVTRKGAVRARDGDMGIIPGSMGAKSYIVRGKGNAESFHELQPWRRARNVSSRSQAAFYGRRSPAHDRRRGMPEGCRRH